MERRRRKPPIPVTLVVGPIGAGKTSLINRLLADPAAADTAVILNEEGRTPIRGGLVESVEEGVMSLSGGCVCCTVRGELVEALERLLRALDNGRIGAIGRVVIEAEASADPSAILAGILRHPYLSLRFSAAGIVAVARADHLVGLLANDRAAVTQIAMADVIVVTGDEAPAEPVATVLARVNPLAAIRSFDAVATADVIETGLWNDAWLAREATAWPARFGEPADTKPMEGEAARIAALVVRRERGFPGEALDGFIDHVAAAYGPGLVRLVGRVATSQGARIVRALGGVFRPPVPLDTSGREHPGTVLAVTLRDTATDAFVADLDSFLDEARIDRPDRAALTDNPLAIAGFSARPGRKPG